MVYRLQSDTAVKDTVLIDSRKDYCSPEKRRCYAATCEYFYDVFYDHSNIEHFPIGGAVSLPPPWEGYKAVPTGGGNFYITHVSSTGKLGSQETIFEYPPHIGDKYSFGSYLKDTGVVVVTPLDTFEHVYHISRIVDSTNPNPHIMNVYLAPKMGIIKIEYTQPNEIWELESIIK